MDNQELYRMIKQAIVENGEDIKRELTREFKQDISDLRTEMNAKFGEIHTRLDKFDEDMDYLKSKFQEHDRDIFLLKKRI